MNLTAGQVRNLNILADFMERLDAPRFTMQVIFHPCGAPACALGWASTIFPTLQEPIKEYRKLFGEVYYELFSWSGHEDLNTPQQWAAHCRAFLKSNGYATDHFKTFMDRVMAPVDTEQLEERERE